MVQISLDITHSKHSSWLPQILFIHLFIKFEMSPRVNFGEMNNAVLSTLQKFFFSQTPLDVKVKINCDEVMETVISHTNYALTRS